MKLASHNSLSYYPPQWWVVAFNWMARCQSLTLEQQYAKGVRLFDIRIKIVNDKVCSGHGIATYKVDFDEIFSFLNNKRDCSVRIILESGNDTRFRIFVEYLMKIYQNIEYTGGQRKRDWKKMINLQEADITHLYWMHKKWWMIPFPYLFAKRHNNKENQRYLNDSSWSMFDFIK